MPAFDFNSVLYWQGHGALGVALTILGSILTVWFSFSARQNAIRAADAADATRSVIKSIDAYAECKKIERTLQDIRLRLDAKQWDRVLEAAESARLSTILILEQLMPDQESSLHGNLVEIKTQMRTLYETAAKQQNEGKGIDVVRVKKVLGNLAEKLMAIEVELRRTVEG